MCLILSFDAGVDEVNNVGYSRAIVFSFIVPYIHTCILTTYMYCRDFVDSSPMLVQPFNGNNCKMYFKGTIHEQFNSI